MQWDLLIPNLKEPERLALVKEKAGLIFSGPSPRCASTLKLGLKKAFELKRKKREPPGVKLRCYNSSCPLHHSHPPYSSITQTTHGCGGSRWYFQCVGCEHIRTEINPSCVGCGKKFI